MVDMGPSGPAKHLHMLFLGVHHGLVSSDNRQPSTTCANVDPDLWDYISMLDNISPVPVGWEWECWGRGWEKGVGGGGKDRRGEHSSVLGDILVYVASEEGTLSGFM